MGGVSPDGYSACDGAGLGRARGRAGGRLHREAPDPDEALGGGVIEAVAVAVGAEARIVHAVRRSPADDLAVAAKQLHAHVARHALLHGGDERVHRPRARR